MLSITSHAAPNVVPGMNFNAARFRELYAWMAGMAADAARPAVGSTHYGLAVAFDGKAPLQLEKTEGLLTLRRCAGYTPAGQAIGIFEGVTPTLETHLSQYQLDPKEPYYVLIELDAEERNPFGPEAEGLPQRPQFSMPACRLHVQPVNQAPGRWANAFPVGILGYENGDWDLTEYIPPCLHIGAHPVLWKKYTDYQEFMNTMLAAQPSIIRQTDSFRDKAMIELREFTMQCGCFLASRKAAYQALSGTGHPFQMLELWMSFANLVDFLLSSLADRPGFYNLLYLNTRSVNGVMLTTERLDNALCALASQEYVHQNMLKTVRATDELLALVTPVFKALGNGALRQAGSNYEEVYKVPATNPGKLHITW